MFCTSFSAGPMVLVLLCRPVVLPAASFYFLASYFCIISIVSVSACSLHMTDTHISRNRKSMNPFSDSCLKVVVFPSSYKLFCQKFDFHKIFRITCSSFSYATVFFFLEGPYNDCHLFLKL